MKIFIISIIAIIVYAGGSSFSAAEKIVDAHQSQTLSQIDEIEKTGNVEIQ